MTLNPRVIIQCKGTWRKDGAAKWHPEGQMATRVESDRAHPHPWLRDLPEETFTLFLTDKVSEALVAKKRDLPEEPGQQDQGGRAAGLVCKGKDEGRFLAERLQEVVDA